MKYFCDNKKAMMNVFTTQKANPQQKNDMLSVYKTGRTVYTHHIQSRILNTPSTDAQV